MGVASKILYNYLWTSKGTLCVNYPIAFGTTGNKALEVLWVVEMGKLFGDKKFLIAIEQLQAMNELATKYLA